MSSVDNRIVQMEFENQQFESGVKSTMSLLERFKSALNFGGDAGKSFEEVQNASKKVNLSGMASAIQNISDKFSLMGQIGFQAMQRIAGSVANAGINLAKSLSIDQVSAGMQKYEEETNAVQTMFYALKDSGTTLEDVYGVLDKVAAYADQTSYSYTQMTNSMSQFITAGVDINKAEVAVEGIANASAKAGIGISQTAILFRNFSDAMSKGAMGLTDYKSLQIGKFDTRDFRKQVIEAAKAVGRLNEEGYVIDKTTGKINKKAQVTIDNFTDMLRYDFMDTEVMIQTLSKYADTTTEFGLEAYHAAQQAKTFSDVIDSLKDVIGTGWKESFRYIFGDLEEAIDFFSWMADAVIDATYVFAEIRNQILSDWKDAGGREDLVEGIKSWFGDFTSIGKEIIDGIFQGMNLASGWGGVTEFGAKSDWLVNLTKSFRTAGEKFGEWLAQPAEHWLEGTLFTNLQNIGRIAMGVGSIANIFTQIAGGVGTFGKEIFGQLSPSISAVLDLFGTFGSVLNGFAADLRRRKVFENLGKRFAKVFTPITNRLPKLIKRFQRFTNEFFIFLKTDERIQKITGSLKNMFNAVLDGAPKALEGFLKWTEGAIETVKNSDEWKKIKANFKKYIDPVVDGFVEFADIFGKDVNEFFTMNTDSSLTWWEQLKQRFSAFDETKAWLSGKWEELKGDYTILQEIENWWTTSPFIAEVKGWMSKFGEAFDAFMNEDTTDQTSLIEKLKARFNALFDVMGPFIQEKWEGLKKDYPWLQDAETLFSSIMDMVKSLTGKNEEAIGSAEEASESMSAVDTIFSAIGEMAKKVKFGDVVNLILVAKGFVDAIRILRTAKDAVNIVGTIKDALQNIGETIEQAFEKIKATKINTKAMTLLTVAGAFALLGVTLKLLGTMEWEDIGKGLAAMAGLFIEEGAFIKIMDVFGEKGSTKISTVNAWKMVGIATAISILGLSLKSLGSMDWDQIKNGLGAMAGLFGETGAFMTIMGFFSSDFAAARGMQLNVNAVKAWKMVGIAIAINVLGNALKSLGSMEWGQIEYGLEAMAGLFAETGAFMVIMGFFSSAQGGAINVNSVKSLKIIGIALAMSSLAGTLTQLGSLNWGQIEYGLEAMAGLFAETGAFMIITGAFSKDIGSLNSLKVIGFSAAMKILANAVVELASIADVGNAWWAIGEMAALFAETGAFTIIVSFFNKKWDLKSDAISIVTGALSAGMGLLANSVAKLAEFNVLDIGKALLAMAVLMVELGAFIAVMGKMNSNAKKFNFNFSISTALSIGIMAGAIWVLAQALIPLSQMDFLSQMLPAIAGMALIMVGLYAFTNAMSTIKFNISGALQGLVGAIAIAGLMVAFGVAVKMVADVPPWTMIAFAVAIDLVTVALIGMTKMIAALQAIPMTGLLVGIAKVALIGVALGLLMAVLGGLAGTTVSNISDDIAHVGAELSLFSDMITGVNYGAINSAVDSLKVISAGLVEIGAKNYGSLDTFRTEMIKLSGALVLLNWGIGTSDPESMKTKVQAIVDMATSMAEVPDIGDVGTSIAKIGGAVKLYSDSFKDVDTSNLPAPPDATTIQGIFTALSKAVPDQSMIDSFLPYADQGKADALTDFAIGIENIGTAVAAYSQACSGLEFGNMTEANGVLTALASIDTGTVTTTKVTAGLGLFGGFAAEVTAQKASLTDFANDVTVLGGALEAYSTSCGKIDTGLMDKATDVVGKIADINNKLPKTGGLSKVLTGEKSLEHFSGNIKLLGAGAASFFGEVSGTEIDTGKVGSAVDALLKIADIQAKLPQLGGIGSWFSGDESLGSFSEGLPKLGTALNNFLTNFGDPSLSQNLDGAIKQLDSIADIQVKLSSKESFYHLDDFSNQMIGMANNLKTANETLNQITWYTGGVDDIKNSALGQLLDMTTDMQVKLGDTVYSKNLKNIGQDLKDFINQIKGTNKDFTDKDGRFSNIADSIEKMFNSITTALEKFKTDNSGSANTLKDVFDGMVTGVSTASEGWSTTLSETGTALVVALETGVSTKADSTNISSIFGNIADAASKAASRYTASFMLTGANFVSGLASGISLRAYVAISAASYLANRIKDTVNSIFKVRSPSRVMMETGMYLDLGLAAGIDTYSTAPINSASSLANGVVSTMNDISKMNLSNLDITPTMRPVLDMSETTGNARLLESMISGRLSARVTGFDTRAATAAAQQVAGGQGTSVDLLTQIRDELINTRDRIGTMEENISNLQLVLDTGALAGGMRDSMNKELGYVIRRERRGG